MKKNCPCIYIYIPKPFMCLFFRVRCTTFDDDLPRVKSLADRPYIIGIVPELIH